ncbi:hypothetical protein [Asticcacaulis sp.]|uniref:terminase small subunit-like protein n=1 Tax=Asticcacaulis sp. TaxID=1872648 RepID=UPI0031DB1691
MARPSKYTPEIAKRICALIARSSVGLATLLDQHDDLPCEDTVYEWLANHDEFPEWYAQAREQQATFLLDEVPEIADDGRNDWMEKFGRDGSSIGWQVNGEAVARSRLRVETRLKLAEKLAPKKYGARQDINLKAAIAVHDLTEDEMLAELVALSNSGVIPPALVPQSDTDDDGTDLV